MENKDINQKHQHPGIWQEERPNEPWKLLPSVAYICTMQNHGIHHQGITCQTSRGKQASLWRTVWVRRGRSCLTNLLETLESWTQALDDGYGLDVIFLDYQKAFDSVPHQRLLEKLNEFGTKEKVSAWIKNFLVLRTTAVGVRETFSDWQKVMSGVPQGSIIGPLLFLLCVNDLPDWIRNELKIFADDTKFWSRIKTVADSTILQQGLNSVCCWSDKWQLRFNVKKCKLMHIEHSLPTDYYTMEGTQKVPLKTVQEKTDLGVVIRSDLKPTSQCNKLAAAARRIIAMVRRHFRKLDVEDFLLIYKTYIKPRLEFCIQSWSPYLHKDIETLKKSKEQQQDWYLSYENSVIKSGCGNWN